MNNDYKTVFDTIAIPFPSEAVAAITLLGVAAACWCIVHLQSQKEGNLPASQSRRLVLIAFCGFAMPFLAMGDWLQYQWLQAKLRSGAVLQVTGIVEDHWTRKEPNGRWSGGKLDIVEHFRVGNAHFEFSRGRGGRWYFSSSKSEPFDFSNGTRLRIAHLVDGGTNLIVKLEVAR